MGVYYEYKQRAIKEGDTVIVNDLVSTYYNIDELIVGKERKKCVGKMYVVKSRKYRQNGAIRLKLEGTGNIVWSPKMLIKIDREENEI